MLTGIGADSAIFPQANNCGVGPRSAEPGILDPLGPFPRGLGGGVGPF